MSSWGLFMLVGGVVAVGGVVLAAAGQRAAGPGPVVGPTVRTGLVVVFVGLAMLLAGVAAQFVLFRSAFPGD